MNRESGISLSEILICLFLTSIMMGTLIQVYLNCKDQYGSTEKILATGFDVQWVSDLLSDSIRRAGFTPCLGLDQLQAIDRRPHQHPIKALHVENTSQSLIQVNRMSERFAQFIKQESPVKLVVQNSAVFHSKRPIVIADCVHAEVHQPINIEARHNETLISLNEPIYFSYDKSAYVGEYLAERWYIKKNTQAEYSLYYQLTHTEELSALIHSLHAKTQLIKGKLFVELELGLEEGKTHHLIVAVRGS